MKVIERRDPRKTFAFPFTCPTCGSKCEADFTDLRCQPASGGNSHDYCVEHFYVKCGVCAQQVSLIKNELSSYMKELVRAQEKRYTEPER